MELHDVYAKVAPSVVAFMTHSVAPQQTADQTSQVLMPVIIGTGFVVGTNLLMTNRHVIEALARLPVPQRGYQAFAVIQIATEKGMAQLPLELGEVITGGIENPGYYYGRDRQTSPWFIRRSRDCRFSRSIQRPCLSKKVGAWLQSATQWGAIYWTRTVTRCKYAQVYRRELSVQSSRFAAHPTRVHGKYYEPGWRVRVANYSCGSRKSSACCTAAPATTK